MNGEEWCAVRRLTEAASFVQAHPTYLAQSWSQVRSSRRHTSVRDEWVELHDRCSDTVMKIRTYWTGVRVRSRTNLAMGSASRPPSPATVRSMFLPRLVPDPGPYTNVRDRGTKCARRRKTCCDTSTCMLVTSGGRPRAGAHGPSWNGWPRLIPAPGLYECIHA
ncbi:hypothetical protein BC826DRAFT_90269 [Russula brevipes]|nr:hypothetical protein BC826DRAFT_90269 [Russula brevipes]